MLRSARYKTRFSEYLILKNYSPQTIKAYERSIDNYFLFVMSNTSLRCSASDYARQYLVHLHYKGLSWSNVNIHYSALVILFSKVLGMEWDYAMIPRPKGAKRLPNIMSHEEVGLLINSIKNHKHQTIVVTLYGTGCRMSELLNLKVNDLDVNGLMIKINNGKGARDRIIHVSTKLMRILSGYIMIYQPDVYLFPGKGSTLEVPVRYSSSSVLKIIHHGATNAGINKTVSAHTFRHSFATHNLDFGSNLEYLRRQLGHADLKTTSRYLHLCRYQNQQLFHPIDHLELQLRGPIL